MLFGLDQRLPDGTRLRLHIRRDGVEFNGEGTVRYVKFVLGMSFAFLHLDDGQKGVLQGWIERFDTSANLNVRPVDSRTSAESQAASSLESSGSNSNDVLVRRLIERLQEKLSGNALAIYNASGLLYYSHPDFLGTARLATTPNRTTYFDTAYAPFGETYASSGTLDPSYTGKMNDTGHRQDTAGGLYDFPVREYSTQGRWPDPDPLGGGRDMSERPANTESLRLRPE
jgi:hypothetical protein